MDSSTLSFTHDKARLPRTSSLLRQPVQPAAEWFTRLISPLTPTEDVPASRSTPVIMQEQFPAAPEVPQPHQPEHTGGKGFSTMLLVLIPILVVVLTILMGSVCFLATVLYMRRKKGIRWVSPTTISRKTDGSVD